MRATLIICVLATIIPLSLAGQTVDALAAREFTLPLIAVPFLLIAAAGIVCAIRWAGTRAELAKVRAAADAAIKARKRTEEQNVILRNRVAAVEKHIFEISHDLSSPLISISGFARSAIRAQSQGKPDQILRYLERVEANAGSMSSLVDSIQAIGRIGQEEPKMTPVRLADIVAALTVRLDGLISEKGATLLCDQNVTVLSDSGMLSRALQNFVENALVHGTVTKGQTIRVRGDHHGRSIRISVLDEGAGIPPDLQPSLFDLLQRADKSKPGRGLGLTIAARIAHQLGGKVGFENSEPRGSTFWIELPDQLALSKQAS